MPIYRMLVRHSAAVQHWCSGSQTFFDRDTLSLIFIGRGTVSDENRQFSKNKYFVSKKHVCERAMQFNILYFYILIFISNKFLYTL